MQDLAEMDDMDVWLYCKDGLSPYVLSYNFSCVECPNSHMNWWKFIFFGFGPLTCFYAFVLVFHINITSSRMQTIVLFSQIITASVSLNFVLSTFPNIYDSSGSYEFVRFPHIWSVS